VLPSNDNPAIIVADSPYYLTNKMLNSLMGKGDEKEFLPNFIHYSPLNILFSFQIKINTNQKFH
jgi:hypothetical protein